jgi:hypothetical protein
MNQRMIRVAAIFTSVMLLAACQSEAQTFIPLTGSGKNESMPAEVQLARESVFSYVVSARFASIPAQADWNLDDGHEVENEYRFRSGDWLMVIWAADDADQNQRVVIFNPIEKISWSGYFAPDGRVIDTAYGR